MADDFNSVLASSVSRTKHLVVFDKIWRKALGDIDLTPLLVYLVDIVPSELLPYLAYQFNMMGFNGWGLTINDDDRRRLIKEALELKRYKGTPWAIKQALRAVGFPTVEIQEGGMEEKYDGTRYYDGTIYHGGGSWANFRVNLLDIGEYRGIGAEDLTAIREMIKRYKNTRSHLLDLNLVANLSDEVSVNDLFLGSGVYNNEDSFGVTKYYNGSFNYNGSNQYSGSSDEFVLNISLTGDSDDGVWADDETFVLFITPVENAPKALVTEDGVYLVTENSVKIITESGEGFYV